MTTRILLIQRFDTRSVTFEFDVLDRYSVFDHHVSPFVDLLARHSEMVNSQFV